MPEKIFLEKNLNLTRYAQNRWEHHVAKLLIIFSWTRWWSNIITIWIFKKISLNIYISIELMKIARQKSFFFILNLTRYAQNRWEHHVAKLLIIFSWTRWWSNIITIWIFKKISLNIYISIELMKIARQKSFFFILNLTRYAQNRWEHHDSKIYFYIFLNEVME